MMIQPLRLRRRSAPTAAAPFHNMTILLLLVVTVRMTSSFSIQSPIVSSPSSKSLLFRESRHDMPMPVATTTTTTTPRKNADTRLFARKVATPPPSSIQTVLTKAKACILSVCGVIATELSQLSRVQALIVAAVFMIGYKLGRTPPVTERFINAVDIPSTYFGPTAPLLKGRVVSVSDGDTFRFRHTPTPFHSSTLEKGQKLSEHSMPIRICTYDTPETPKFGKPGQPYGMEAKEELIKLISDKMIYVRLLQKDQYGRAVAQVFKAGSKSKCIDEHMLKAGLGEVYVGMGAVYGPLGKDKYMELQEDAKKAKKGIWSQGDKRESAAEYKKRTK